MNKTLASLAMASALFSVTFSAAAEVTVTDAWVRGMVKGQTETGAYMTIKSTEPTKLVGVSSPVTKVVQLHEMKMDGDVMTMRPLKSLAVPADKPLSFGPDGYHIMLIDLKKPLAKGESVPLKLTFRSQGGKKSSVEVKAEVRALTEPSAPAPMDHAHMQH